VSNKYLTNNLYETLFNLTIEIKHYYRTNLPCAAKGA